jgi:hypothetical protein
VPRSNSRSFKIAYPDAVAEKLQRLTYIVAGKADDPRDILKDKKTRHNIGDKPENLSPEISFVSLSSAPSSQRDGLARRSSVNNVNWCANILTPQCPDILKDRHIRPVPV